MEVDLTGRSFLTLLDFNTEEIKHLLKLAHRAKKEKHTHQVSRRFEGKSLALIFEKRSTRTRCAFETAFGEEGGHPVFLSSADIQLGSKESVEDTARVLGRMFDAIQFRGYSQQAVTTLAQQSGVPVYNGLTDDFHPTQILADLMTMEEEFGELKGRKMVYIGDGRNNVALSLMIGCAKLGVNFAIAAPHELFPSEELMIIVNKLATESGSEIVITDNIDTAVKGADALYTDVWISMGEEDKALEREALLKPYQVSLDMMKKTGKSDSIFLHCLPAVKGKEVTEELFEAPCSKVFNEAENRKHTIKAVMLATLCGE